MTAARSGDRHAAPAARVFLALIGTYQALTGTVILIAPLLFPAAVSILEPAARIALGAAFLIGGVALLWAILLPIRQPGFLPAACALAAISLCAMAVQFGRAIVSPGAILYGTLALMTAVTGVLAWHQPAGVRARFLASRAVALLAAGLAIATGLLIATRPELFASFVYDPVRPWLPQFSAAFIILGAVLILLDAAAPGRFPSVRAGVGLMLALVLLGWGIGFAAAGVWTTLLAYIVLAIGTAQPVLAHWVPATWTAKPLFGDPLRRRVTLTVMTTLVGATVIVTFILSANTANAVRDRVRADAETLAATVAEQLRFYLDTHLAIVGQVAHLPSMRSGDVEQSGEVLRDTLEAFPGFANLSLVDRTGQQLVRADDEELVDLSGRPAVQRALAGEPLVFAGVSTSLSTGNPIVAMAAPIRDPSTDEIIGAVSASIQLTSIESFLSGLSTTLGREVYVFAADGQVIVDPTSSTAQPADDAAGTATFTITRQAEQGSTEYAADGERYLAGFASVSPFGWKVVVQQPDQVALADIRRIEERAFLVLLAMAALLSALALMLVGRLYRPLTELLVPVRALSEGNYAVPCQSRRKGRLATSCSPSSACAPICASARPR